MAVHKKLKAIIISISSDNHFQLLIAFFMFSNLICNLGVIVINSRPTCLTAEVPCNIIIIIIETCFMHVMVGVWEAQPNGYCLEVVEL